MLSMLPAPAKYGTRTTKHEIVEINDTKLGVFFKYLDFLLNFLIAVRFYCIFEKHFVEFLYSSTVHAIFETMAHITKKLFFLELHRNQAKNGLESRKPKAKTSRLHPFFSKI